MGHLPKDYVGVNVRVDKAHEKHGEKLSIITSFETQGSTVIFTAVVTVGTQTFTGHSFGETGREKSFEKLETVAVGRALAFAGFETRSGIASREENEIWESKKVEEDKPWFNEPHLKKLIEVKDEYEDGEAALRDARVKYRLSKEMAARILSLYDPDISEPAF